MATHSVLLFGKFRGWRSLVGNSPWGCKELDMTEQLYFLSIISSGEGNCNPLQCCCLENPMDGGAWWAAVYGVAESDMTKQLTHTQKMVQLAVISKITSKNLSTELSLGIAQYTPGHLTQLNDYSQTFISSLYIMEHLTFIQRLVTEISFRNNLRMSVLII